MGVLFPFGFSPVESHEGYAARLLPSGELTGSSLREFTAYVAACDCGWRGSAHPATEAGENAALDEWHLEHMHQLAPRLARGAAARPAKQAAGHFLDAGQEGAPRPLRALVGSAALQALADECASRVQDLVRQAIADGASWKYVGDALGTSPSDARAKFAHRAR